MPYSNSNGLNIYYEIEGSGPEVVMIHGFAADVHSNWRVTRVVDTLKAENRLVMMDCRGHGKSDRPTDPAMYGMQMVDDITNLMDHLGIERANFLGYSMGARLSLGLTLAQPERVKSLILGGFGLPSSSQTGSETDPTAKRRAAVAQALLADTFDQITDPVSRGWRSFAESTGGDLKALAAVMMGSQLSELDTRLEKLQSISIPLLTIVGNDDSLVGDKSRMAMLVPNGCHFQVQGKDHITVVAGTRFRMMVRAFLNFVNGG